MDLSSLWNKKWNKNFHLAKNKDFPISPTPWRDLSFVYLFFFTFSGVYQILIFLSGLSGGTGLRQVIYMSFLWLIPILLFPSYTRIIAGIIGIILWSSSLVNLGYFALYGQDFSQSVIFIIFESNITESSEFLQSYFHWWMLIALIIYSYIPFLLWRFLRPVYLSKKQKTLIFSFILILTSWPLSNQYFRKDAKTSNC
jgi:heptose-I-phosphate ethanolaminephosphotransferase